ncbi:protein ROOT PRIMORDIUM DEFECTIVE 1 [Cinnamomum micranthum f. kanehirae]|uniref:Protein ROOT PRIMORDIUM DEFECTIVE 1 n=1 Tax=Cinnamomum micranthum f. kanehirae TaxID=337451 RepID=A0A3S4PYW9_9MAGN|nr:protein ROOT PRIMORDIUM DEFECTIVE 1 [Cinnamomum micranthum f. kanehirae]
MHPLGFLYFSEEAPSIALLAPSKEQRRKLTPQVLLLGFLVFCCFTRLKKGKESSYEARKPLELLVNSKTCLLIPLRPASPYILYQGADEQLGLGELKVSTFIRQYPTLFQELTRKNSDLLCFQLTEDALKLYQEELQILQQNEMDLILRLRKLLMITVERTLPLQTIDQLKWDMGLPQDYQQTLIPHYPQFFGLVKLSDDRIGLKLLHWDNQLAVSELQKNGGGYGSGQNLAFPVKFTRGFGLKRKCMAWLSEWQQLPYTSPYADPSNLDPRTDESEKRNVGVFHELLHLTITKRTERKNVSNLRKPLQLPQKFTKVFERHPGIFYISQKCATQTVMLREAYEGPDLVRKHPLIRVREKYASLMRTGMLNRSRGLYKKITIHFPKMIQVKKLMHNAERNGLHTKGGENGVCLTGYHLAVYWFDFNLVVPHPPPSFWAVCTKEC